MGGRIDTLRLPRARLFVKLTECGSLSEPVFHFSLPRPLPRRK